MASAIMELPPLGKISMIGIWIETLLYGVNLVAYGLCMHSLFRRGKATGRLVLKVTCTVIFLLCTVHVAASLRQLLEAFVYAPADAPNYPTVYWHRYPTPLRWLKDIIYNTLVLAQDFILIWRLYVVFMGDARVVVFPIIFAAGSVGSLYASSSIPYGPATNPLVIASLGSSSILNVLVTGGIVARLWWIGRRIASLTATSTNRFASSMYVVLESGAFSAVCDTIVLVLFVTQSPIAFSSLDVVVQLNVLVPLLIIIQAGKTSPYNIESGDLLRKAPTTPLDEMRFQAVVPRERASWQDDDSVYAPSTTAAPDARM